MRGPGAGGIALPALFSFLLSAAAPGPVAASGQPVSAAADPALVVGLLLPPDEPEARSIRRGAEAAVAEANGPGRPVRLAVRGRQGAWGSDASEAARLLEDDGATALVAPPGGAATHLALQVAGRTGIPVASLSPDGSVTRTALPWMVRVAPSTSDEARALLRALPSVRWIAFVPEGRPGREAARDLAEGGGSAIVRVVEVSAPPSPRRLRELLSEARAGGALLWLDAAPAARLAVSLRGAGFTGALAGPMRLGSPSFASDAAGAAEGFVVPAFPPGGSPDFARRFRALHGEDPTPAASLAHDATALLVGLLARPGGAARDAFPLSTPFDGATGSLRFDRSGNRIVSLEPRRWRGGRLVGL